MYLTLRASASSGWVPAAIVTTAAGVVAVAYGVSIPQLAIFGAYVAFGIALPGLLWVRYLRGRPAHIAEDLTLGVCAGYCLEIATYVAGRAIGAPLLIVVWPLATLIAFIVVPALRRYWHGDGSRAPIGWSWALATILGFLLIYSAGTVFAQHHLTGTDTPYVDMPFQLALIAELRHHVPPMIPYVSGVDLAYHWFVHAEAAATSWATGIEPIVLLYRLSGLPMFVAFVVLTAVGARRLTDSWWTGPIAVGVALFGAVATPYDWVANPVFETQTLYATWISPTNLFGLALFAAVVLLFFDVLADDAGPRRRWLLVALVVAGAAGAKASLLPLLIVGLLAVVAGVAVSRRRLHVTAAAGLVLAGVAFVVATILLFRGTSGGLAIGWDALRSFPLVALPGARTAGGLVSLVMPIVGLLIGLLLWSFLWAGAYGLLARRQGSRADPRILLLIGICAAGLGAVAAFSYPGLSQAYFLKGAAGAFGILTATGIAAIVPARTRYGPLIACVVVAALVGAAAVSVIAAIGPSGVPRLGTARLSGVLPLLILPILALVAVAVIAYVVLRRAEPRWRVLQGAVPLLVIAVVMGFSLPAVARVVALPFAGGISGLAVDGDGIAMARWLRDHSAPDDLVATNLHCRPLPEPSGVCDARHFWVSGFSERRTLVEGWAYTSRAVANAKELDVSDILVPFWNPALLADNDSAFSNPSAAAVDLLRDRYGVRWLFADGSKADLDALGRVADLRERRGAIAIYELRRP